MSEQTLLSDSISETVGSLKELLSQMPPSSRGIAKHAAVQVENTILKLKADFPRNPAVALGTAYALFRLCEQMIEKDRPESGESLIQLL